MRFQNTLTLLPLFLASALAAQTPVGGLFQVNTTTRETQQWPAPAMAPDGAFVVVWEDVLLPQSHWEINGQLFAADGNPVGDEVQVNTYTPDPQTFASVAMGPDGSFVVVWDDAFDQSGNYGGVFGQRFDAFGDPLQPSSRLGLHLRHRSAAE
ncbi:MAG: hypothetical protein GY953_32540 [bacterium]|nr:hypothetical protein [bacterium]